MNKVIAKQSQLVTWVDEVLAMEVKEGLSVNVVPNIRDVAVAWVNQAFCDYSCLDTKIGASAIKMAIGAFIGGYICGCYPGWDEVVNN